MFYTPPVPGIPVCRFITVFSIGKNEFSDTNFLIADRDGALAFTAVLDRIRLVGNGDGRFPICRNSSR